MSREANQAPVGALLAAEAAAVAAAIERWAEAPGALLPILHQVQEALGFVPPAALEPIAQALHLSRAEVHGVVTFYHDFRTRPPGAHVLKVCRAEACQAVGCRELEAHVASSLGLGNQGEAVHGTTRDGQITVEPIYCLGNCALGPSIQLDGKLYGKVTPKRLDALLAPCRAAATGGGRP